MPDPKEDVQQRAYAQWPSTVYIDGDQVRQLREGAGLTQLYVATVVGVTTDTISRWENKRYPTVKKENLVRLAEALETSPESLWAKEEPQAEPVSADAAEQTGPDPNAPPGSKRSKRRRLYGLLLAIVCAGVLVYVWGWIQGPRIHIKRTLPAYGAPGTAVPVVVCIAPVRQDHLAFVLRETYPQAWNLLDAEPIPTSAPEDRPATLRWIGQAHRQQKTCIAYRVQVPADAQLGSQASFAGQAVLSPAENRQVQQLAGDVSMQIKECHWADSNGDKTIDDSEILAAFELVEAWPQLGLDWELVKALWDAGAYRFQGPEPGFVPVSAHKGFDNKAAEN